MIIIQPKTAAAEYIEVDEESTNWFVTKLGSTYSKDRYMKVSSGWLNVTREITIKEPIHKMSYNPGGVYHNNTKIAELVCGGKYRLRITGTEAVIEKRV